jgi:hypothetical protein
MHVLHMYCIGTVLLYIGWVGNLRMYEVEVYYELQINII